MNSRFVGKLFGVKDSKVRIYWCDCLWLLTKYNIEKILEGSVTMIICLEYNSDKYLEGYVYMIVDSV